MGRHIISAAAAAVLLAGIALPAPAFALDEAQKKEFGEFIREYLIANPEIIEEAQFALQAKREAEKVAMAKSAIGDHAEQIFNAPGDMVIGNPDGDVTVVEFFDYNCGFCKRALSDMQEIVKEDPNIRFVLKEFPILGPDSMAAHRVAMSFRKLMPEKYEEFHVQLLGSEVRATEEQAIAVATSLGADESKLRDGMDDPEIVESIRLAYSLADALGINGTPAYVIGDEAIFGAMGTEVLQKKIANVRKCQSTVC